MKTNVKSKLDLIRKYGIIPVSYTHLDVYKRQIQHEGNPAHEEFGQRALGYGSGADFLAEAARRDVVHLFKMCSDAEGK